MEEATDAILEIGLRILIVTGPLLVIAGWIFSLPMNLVFDKTQTAAYGFTVWMLIIFVQGGKSNYYKGAFLLGMYLVLGLCLVLFL